MRHEQPDETDEPRRGDGARGEQRGGDVHRERDARDAHAESRRGVLAEREHVDGAREGEQHEDAAPRPRARRAAPAASSRR